MIRTSKRKYADMRPYPVFTEEEKEHIFSMKNILMGYGEYYEDEWFQKLLNDEQEFAADALDMGKDPFNSIILYWTDAIEVAKLNRRYNKTYNHAVLLAYKIIDTHCMDADICRLKIKNASDLSCQSKTECIRKLNMVIEDFNVYIKASESDLFPLMISLDLAV